MDKVRIGVVGCGAIAETMHMPGIKAIEEMGKCRVVAVCDMLEERAKLLCDKFGVPAYYTDFGKMLAEADFDLLLNTTRIPEHFQVTLQALRSGKNVYTQKPMATTVAEATILIEEAKKQGVKLATAPEHRVRAVVRKMKELVDSGAIGKVAFARVRSSHDGPEKHLVPRDSSWYYQPGTNPILDLGVHGLAQITSILGPVKKLACFSGRSVPERVITAGPFAGKRFEVAIDDNSLLMLDFGDGRFVQLDATYCVMASLGPRIEIFGTEGTLALVSVARQSELHLYRLETKEWSKVEVEQDPPTRDLGMLHMVDCLREGKELMLTAEHGRHLVEVMTAAPVAAQEGRTIAMETSF